MATVQTTSSTNQHHHHQSSNNNSSSSNNNMSTKEKEREKKLSMYKIEPYKTELRREHIARRRELTRQHFLNRERTQAGEGQKKGQHGKIVSRNVVTIDTHKARGNSDVLRMVIRDLGWREFPFMRRDHNCDVIWHAVNFHDQPDIYSGQVNKFPGALEIFQKVNLFRWLEFMKSLFPEEYDFFPRTWLLPQQFTEFASEVRCMQEKKPKQKPVFIVKPSEGSQGEGIYLLKDPQHYIGGNSKSHVVQEYLSNVLLLEKYKFDLRIYVVLRCLDPLEFHICKEGLARFSTIPYEQPNNKNLAESYMHLTNYSLNKRSSDFKISDKDDEGSKRKMTAVLSQLSRLGHDTEALWARIEQIVSKTLIAVVGELKIEMQAAAPSGKPGPTCFQVLGFDVLIMKNLDPMLLEVNSNPSLSITEEHETATGGVEYLISSKDEDVKRKLVRDTLILIAPKNKYTRKRRKRRKQRNYRQRRRDEGEEPMDVDWEGGAEDGVRPNKGSTRRREKDISIRYMDMDEDKGTGRGQRSIFDDADYNSSGSNHHQPHLPKKFVRNETCRVFIEGEGEVLFDEDGPSNPKYFSNYRDAQAAENSASNKKDLQRRDTNDRLPSVFLKSGDRPVDMIIVEDDREGGEQDAGPPRPLPFDLSLLDSSDEEDEEEESCLKEIFPAVYGDSYEEQRIVERLADIFITCLGVKGCLRLGPTMFRLFARKCRLNRKGITNAAIDILYIDMQRRWEYMNPDRTSDWNNKSLHAPFPYHMKGTPNPGLNLHTFILCCVKLAHDYFRSSPNPLEAMVAQCELYLALERSDPEAALREREREMRRRRRRRGGDEWRQHKRHSDAGDSDIRQDSFESYLPPLDVGTGSAPTQKKSSASSGQKKGAAGELDSTNGSFWPPLLSEKYNDRSFPSPKYRHKNIFHLLQDVRK
ncbi:tubulin polyglutamylase ttll11 [Plakobranchus ocellatus]|uniref:Tubulin polyglutamylase ttll11 n=1 Tax=Plakobranchus ocellatus TaxID=259542 RepID=A0AAV3XS40_9GAST|nr:tubulin polyglutamylase ttll11 [Plakobranchus ocellatus]